MAQIHLPTGAVVEIGDDVERGGDRHQDEIGTEERREPR